MKRTLLFFLLFLPMLQIAVSASERIDGIYYNLDSTKYTAEVVFHVRYYYKGDVVIPSSVTYGGADYSVTRILSDAFKGSSELTSITIPSSVTSIGTGIFNGCTSLAAIVVGEGNPKFDSRDNCNAIIETASNTLLLGCKGTIIPKSVPSIGNNAFSGCSSMTSFNIPNHVVMIGESTFEGCTGLTSLTIPKSVTTIGKDAFKDCGNLTKIELNNNAIVSKDYDYNSTLYTVFGGQVKEYVLGEDVKSIGKYAFYDCPNLSTVKMSNNITRIGEFAFSGCRSLTSVDMSDNLTSIGDRAFSGCRSLNSITIPSGVTNLELTTFYECTGLTKVVLNSNAIVSKNHPLTSPFSKYFGPQVKEYVLGEEITGIGKYAFESCTALTSVNIPSGVTSIGEGAFQNCINLTSISIPKNVTSIGDDVFYNCNGLTSIQVESGNTAYDSRGNCNALIRTADNTLIAGCQNTIIPTSVTAIGDNAFIYCTGLTSISIPNSVKSIGNGAFAGCSGLTSISISNGVITIGKNAFSGCKGLTSVTIPNSVTTIDEAAFSSCSGLTSITIPSSVKSIGVRAFQNCSGLTSIQVESGNTVYDSRDNCNAIIETATNTMIVGCQKTVIPNSVTSIGDCAFFGCTELTSIRIPNVITSIGFCAFDGCIGLTSVTLPNSVTSIGYSAFTGCSNLATVILGNALTNIGEGVFTRCFNFKDMYCYAEQVPELGNNVFDIYHYKATLHVPASSVDAYNTTAQWMDFGIIVALTDSDPKPTGIKGINDDVMSAESYYSVDGKQTATPQRGLNIIRMSDGTTKKIVIK